MHRRQRQRGQGLLIVLGFVAVFLFLIWASLRLASDSILDVTSVQRDSKTTYALDSGTDYVIGWLNVQGGNLCALGAARPAPLVLPYPAPLTVTITTITPAGGCTRPRPILNITATVSGSPRRLLMQVSRPVGTWQVTWQAYQ